MNILHWHQTKEGTGNTIYFCKFYVNKDHYEVSGFCLNISHNGNTPSYRRWRQYAWIPTCSNFPLSLLTNPWKKVIIATEIIIICLEDKAPRVYFLLTGQLSHTFACVLLWAKDLVSRNQEITSWRSTSFSRATTMYVVFTSRTNTYSNVWYMVGLSEVEMNKSQLSFPRTHHLSLYQCIW
jgi:hypothetical protein